MINQFFGAGLPSWGPVAGLGLAILLLWSMFWKGLALWHSARRGAVGWYLIILIINTAGILEIIYLFFVAKIRPSELFTKDPQPRA